MKKKILFVCARHPLETTVRDGGVALTKSNFECLQNIADLKVESILQDQGSLFEKLKRVAFAFFGFAGGLYPERENKILRKCSEKKWDIVFIDNSNYGRLARSIREKFPNVQVICHFHNIEQDYALQSLRAPYFIRKIISKSSAANELLAKRFADTLICLSKKDSDILFAHYGRNADWIIPLSLPSSESSLPATESTELLFCGSLFGPNIDGLTWFIQDVLPELDMKLNIVGFRMELAPLPKSPLVRNLGTVDNLEEHYRNAYAVINPVLVGSGMKTKTIEALKYGKAIFGTSQAWLGIEPLDNLPLYRCDNKTDFIQKIKAHRKQTLGSFFPEVQGFFESNFSNSKKKFTLKEITYPADGANVVGAVVTSFNPPDDFYQNIATIAEQAAKVIIVDNGSAPNYQTAFAKIAQDFTNVEVILNSKNLGVGTALNQGVEKLLQDQGVTWIATFDHDTLIPHRFFLDLLAAAKKHASPNVQIMGPNFGSSSNSSVRNVKTLITSGTVIHRYVFSKIGLFRADFFIDSIDHEFCLRALDSGTRIAQVNSVKMQHGLGYPKKVSAMGMFSFYTLNYSTFRKYYMFRNFIFLVRLYRNTQLKWLISNSSFLVKEAVKTVFFEKNKMGNIKALLKGLRHGLFAKISAKDFSI